MNHFFESVQIMIKNGGIAFRMGAPVLVGSALVFLVIFTMGYQDSRKTILRNVEENAQNLARRIAHRIELVLAPVEKVPENLDIVLETFDLNETKIIEVLSGTLHINPDVFGAAIAFEPYAFDSSHLYFSPYLSRKGKGFQVTKLGGKDYHYFYQDWYQIPRETGKSSWSEPYFDEGGGDIPMATYSLPFYRAKEGTPQFTGVITADISLEWLEKIVSDIHVLQTGYGFIVSQNGTFIAHPQKSWVLNETIFSIAEARDDAMLRAIGKRMIAGESGFFPFSGDISKRAGFLYLTPIGFSNWSLGIFFPKNELMADLETFRRTAISLGLSGLLVLVLVVWLVARTITHPLRILSSVARDMATGNLEIQVPLPKTGDEVAVLAQSLDFMKNSLKNHIRDLLASTIAKEHIESELTIAREIQMGLLPKTFPLLPDLPAFDLYALLKPAREVGGDLYDFYRIDDERVCFFLGDVSGKGVPAALFMAVTMTLIKMTATKGLSPDCILKDVNAQLSRNNDTGMFVTLFCGIINIRTRELWYSNGGHNPPVLLPSTGKATFLEGTDGLLLGAMEDIDYTMKRIILTAGEGLFLYSDGVTEAMDEKESLYSEERLIDCLNAMGGLSSEEVVNGVIKSVLSFAGAAAQADDITAMMVRL
jgi:phosphoserine phosphatase RsbU/P